MATKRRNSVVIPEDKIQIEHALLVERLEDDSWRVSMELADDEDPIGAGDTLTEAMEKFLEDLERIENAEEREDDD